MLCSKCEMSINTAELIMAAKLEQKRVELEALQKEIEGGEKK